MAIGSVYTSQKYTYLNSRDVASTMAILNSILSLTQDFIWSNDIMTIMLHTFANYFGVVRVYDSCSDHGWSAIQNNEAQ